MTRRLVRLIGGVGAGEEVWTDGKSDRVRVIKHPDFAFCSACAPEAPEPNVLYQHFEEYEIKRVSFVEGYVHLYGYPAKGASAAHALNELWNGYKQSVSRR
jgi:hypothetical protein